MTKYSLENLNKPDFIDELRSEIEAVEHFNDVKEAATVFAGLKKALKQYDKEIGKALADEYRAIIIRLRFILFLSQASNEVEELLGKYLSVGISMTYIDMLEILKIRISFLPIDDRDDFKKQLRGSIQGSHDLISTKPIEVDKKRIRPTIAGWLNYYNAKLGTGLKNNLEVNNFFINDSNIKKLEKLEKLWIRELVNIYEYLKRSSTKLEGNEDDEFIKDTDGKTYLFKDGAFTDIAAEEKRQFEISDKKLNIPKTVEEKKIDELKRESKQYTDSGLEQRVIEEEVDKNQQIEDLRIEANKYKEGSLERLAMEEEIKKLSS